MQYREHLSKLLTAIKVSEADRSDTDLEAIVYDLSLDIAADVLTNIRRIADALEAGNELQREILAKMDKR